MLGVENEITTKKNERTTYDLSEKLKALAKDNEKLKKAQEETKELAKRMRTQIMAAKRENEQLASKQKLSESAKARFKKQSDKAESQINELTKKITQLQAKETQTSIRGQQFQAQISAQALTKEGTPPAATRKKQFRCSKLKLGHQVWNKCLNLG